MHCAFQFAVVKHADVKLAVLNNFAGIMNTAHKLISFLRKRITMSPDFDGAKIRTVHNGKKMFTPMIVVFITIAVTDVIFAFDSIPAR